jgi:hypothetical protein
MMTDAINSHSRRMYNAQKKTRADLANPLDDPRVKVKALVWQRNGDHHAGGYGYVIRKMGSRYTLTVRNNHGQNFDTIEAAKAAAQAYHDGTILAALEPSNTAADRIDELEAKLAKAVEELENMQKVPRSDASYGILMVMIKYTLAELKGQKDE